MNFISIQEMGDKFLTTDIAGEVFSSLIVIGIELILFLIIGIRAHFHDPLKKPKGLLLLGEIGVNFFDNMAEGLMGPRFRNFGGYIMAIAVLASLNQDKTNLFNVMNQIDFIPNSPQRVLPSHQRVFACSKMQ